MSKILKAIEETRKDMKDNNIKQQPIAWKDDLEFYTNEDYNFFVNQGISKDLIPLYAKPQTKPLSDEEIHDIWKSLWEGGNIGHIAYNYARAIEERHGIK